MLVERNAHCLNDKSVRITIPMVGWRCVGVHHITQMAVTVLRLSAVMLATTTNSKMGVKSASDRHGQ